MKSISILLLTKAIELILSLRENSQHKKKTEERMPVGKEPGQNGTKEAEADKISAWRVRPMLEHYKG